MKITIIGTGWVGLISGVCFADLGNFVTCVDKDQNKIASLNRGILPIFEPGLKKIFLNNYKKNRLFFSRDFRNSIRESDIIINTVGTPPHKNGKCDLSGIKNVARHIGSYLNGYKVIINRSTVPVGGTELMKNIISLASCNKYNFDIVFNPEFFREGKAIQDFLVPDRIVVGVESPRAKKILKELYTPFVRNGRPILFTTIRAAELIKYAANAFLATRISFINEIANYCDKINVDIKEVERGIGLDSRIGRQYLRAGIGFGGSCLPKDLSALIEHAREDEYKFKILAAVQKVNKRQRFVIIEKLRNIYPDLKNKRIAIWGVAFKPDSDDIREAPSIDIIRELLDQEAKIQIFDPVALTNLQKIFSSKELAYYDKPYQALKNSEALLVLTEWNEFRFPDFKKIKELMRKPIILDGRNIYDPQKLKRLEFQYSGIGRQ